MSAISRKFPGPWLFPKNNARVEVLTKNNVRLAVNSGEKKLFSPKSARIF